MTRTHLHCVALALALVTLSSGCGENDETVVPLPAASTNHPAPWDPDADYEPGITAAALSTEVDNPLMPSTPGLKWVYEGQTDEGMEHTEVEVLPESREVWGVEARVVRDTVYRDGELIEDTWDWYAQDADGNVWYLGEDTYEYENGEKVCDCGAWESGVDGALPGIVMLADPKVGDAYRQEYYPGDAEDLAEVVEADVSVSVAAGDFEGCVRTRETTVLERDVEEFKVACPGVGVVLEEAPADDERTELTSFTDPSVTG